MIRSSSASNLRFSSCSTTQIAPTPFTPLNSLHMNIFHYGFAQPRGTSWLSQGMFGSRLRGGSRRGGTHPPDRRSRRASIPGRPTCRGRGRVAAGPIQGQDCYPGVTSALPRVDHKADLSDTRNQFCVSVANSGKQCDSSRVERSDLGAA